MLLEKISEGLDGMLKEYSSALGNRGDYIGASDVPNCERKVVLSKIHHKGEVDDEKKMVFLRGHTVETIVRNLLTKAGLNNFKEQFEVVHPEYDFIRAHIDFLFYSEKANEYGVMEVKTTTNIPETPYESWVMQLQMQIGLMKLNYPNAKIKGAVFVLDLVNGKMRVFSGYEYSEELFNALVDKAKRMHEKVVNKDTENLETEISSLCAFCPFKASCPQFTGDEQNISDDLKKAIKKYNELSKREKEIKREKDDIKKMIIEAVGEGTIKADGNKIVIKHTKRKDFDVKRLQKENPDIYNEYLTEKDITYFRIF